MWSDVEYVYRCLADTERTTAFRDAIDAVVKPGAIVLDLGTGSGIMAILAARAGAGRVFAVEVGPYLSRVSRRNFDISGFGAKITSIRSDARALDLTIVEKPDVVISEMITTGLLGEMQAPVLSSLRDAGVIDQTTIVIPATLTTSVTLVQTHFDFLSITLRFPIFVDYFSKAFDRPVSRLSAAGHLHTITFNSSFSEDVDVNTHLTVSNQGSLNGLLLSTTTEFLGATGLGSCISYCQPVILPLTPEIDVLPGDTIAVHLRYRLGDGFDSLDHAAERI